MTRTLISRALPGGMINKPLMDIFNKTLQPTAPKEYVVPTFFISEIHEHPEITPARFLQEWENIKIVELRQLLESKVSNDESTMDLFFKVLNKIKIPGLGSCAIEKFVPTPSCSTRAVSTTTGTGSMASRLLSFLTEQKENFQYPINREQAALFQQANIAFKK